jgi:hypothetical protein
LLKDAHHVAQDAAVRELAAYDYTGGAECSA